MARHLTAVMDKQDLRTLVAWRKTLERAAEDTSDAKCTEYLQAFLDAMNRVIVRINGEDLRGSTGKWSTTQADVLLEN